MSDRDIVRVKHEIEELEEDAIEATIAGTKFPELSYEDGVLAAIRWLTDSDESHPIRDD